MGYIHEFELPNFSDYRISNPIAGNVFNPFFVVAKRWGNNFHSLIYTGPKIIQHLTNSTWEKEWQINTNFHYMISGTKNFGGVEFNKSFNNVDFDLTIRPQMWIQVTDQLMVGIVSGIPISRENQRFSSFLRLIYEPPHK